MKKLCLIPLLSLILTIIGGNSAVADESEWGVADTIASHLVGPGITYTKIVYPNFPLILWFTEIDLSNEYAKVEQVQSRHAVPDADRWDVMTHFTENSSEGHKVRVAWNHDFFSYDWNVCIGNNVSEGEMTWVSWGRSLLAISKDGTASVFNPNSMVCQAITENGTIVSIDRFNTTSLGVESGQDCVLFNRFNATTLDMDGLYIKIQAQAEWTVNGDDVPCQVLEISEIPIQTTANEYVLFARNDKAETLKASIEVGGIINIAQNFPTTSWGVAPKDILNAFHGYPSLAHDGVLHEGEYNDFESGREYETSAHVLAGISEDGTKLYVLINEMSSDSQAVDCVELTNWMLKRGSWDIVNFDSGGSAAIVVDGDMLNLPARGSVRAVQDAMLAVSLAPEDNQVAKLRFSRQQMEVSAISLTPLRVLSYNKYDDILVDDLQGCTFRCEPSNIGYVDDEMIFHSNSETTMGKIIATKDGVEGEITVNVVGVEGVAPLYYDALINTDRGYFVEIEGYTGGGAKVEVDPSALTWSVDDAQICTVDGGMLKGISNGTATVSASFGDEITFDVEVTVEKAIGSLEVMDFINMTDYLPTYSSVSNMTIGTEGLPSGWSDGAVCTFDVSSGRSNYIKLSKAITLYSVPDSISLQMYDEQDLVNAIAIQYIDSRGSYYTVNATTDAGDGIYSFSFADILATSMGFAKFPLTINTIQFTLKSATITGAQLALRDFSARYADNSDTGIGENIITNNEPLDIKVLPEQIEMIFEAEKAENVNIFIYSMTGKPIYQSKYIVSEGTNNITLDTKALPVGIYLVGLSNLAGTKVEKFIIR